MSHTPKRLPSEPIPLKRLGYRVNDFVAITGISRSTFYDLLKDGKIKTIRIGGRRIVPAIEAERIVVEGG
jgi:excisionase family DNA binding protein